MGSNKVFIVEDDTVIMAAHLQHGRCVYSVQVCNFEKITEEVEEFQPDIINMDIKLPYYNGFYWCAETVKRPKYRSFSCLLRTIT